MTPRTITRISLFSLALLGCAGDPPDGPDHDDVGGGSGDTAGGEDNTFSHPTDADIWGLYDRLAEEGPARYAARLHSCPKMRYDTLGRVLASRGVNLDAEEGAGRTYRDSVQTLGGPFYAARQAENLELTTAAASRLFDIFMQAAPEIIANMEASEACGVPLFTAEGSCNADGISCLIGLPATPAHVALCQEMVSRATTPEKGRVIAVAALAAAGHTCE